MAPSTTPSQPGPDGHRTRTGKLPEPVGGSVRRLTSGPGRSRIPAPDWLGRLVWRFGFNPRLAQWLGGLVAIPRSGVDRLGCRWILVPRGLAATGFFIYLLLTVTVTEIVRCPVKENFEIALALVFDSEGGWSNHPKDRGGKTNFGITNRTWKAWAKLHGDSRSLAEITREDAAKIYREDYAGPVRFDSLPGGLDYAVLDFAINSGAGTAVAELQGCLAVRQDGIMGSQTLAAVSHSEAKDLIHCLCEARRKYVRKLDTWGTFGKGWLRRIAKVEQNATRLAAGRRPAAESLGSQGATDSATTQGYSGKAVGPNRIPVYEYAAPLAGLGAVGAGLADTVRSVGEVRQAVSEVFPPWVCFLVLGGIVGFLTWRLAKYVREN